MLEHIQNIKDQTYNKLTTRVTTEDSNSTQIRVNSSYNSVFKLNSHRGKLLNLNSFLSTHESTLDLSVNSFVLVPPPHILPNKLICRQKLFFCKKKIARKEERILDQSMNLAR